MSEIETLFWPKLKDAFQLLETQSKSSSEHVAAQSTLLAEQGERLSQLSNRQQVIEDQMSNLSARQVALGDQMTALLSRQDVIEDKVETIEGLLQHLSAQVASLSALIASWQQLTND